jgi:hypothetical protein
MAFELKSHLNQNYELLKHKCLQAGTLFKDEKFPADNTSISLIKKNTKPYRVYWKRPHEISNNPKFIVNSIKPNNIVQGDTGNCWFISAVATLATIPNYFRFVMPVNQAFDSPSYAGIFHFRFWQFGEWLDVVVDDRLPVDENDALIYCRNKKDENEFCLPLLEKAYAKLAACYEFLNTGDPGDAMIDMSGAVSELFDLKKCIEKSYKTGDFNDSQEERALDEIDDNIG